MKWNWGTGIALFYLAFMGAMLFFVGMSKRYDHSLVREDYYKEDLAYQQQYDRLVHTTDAASTAMQYDATSQQLAFQFAETALPQSGSITFFRPSNSQLDLVTPIKIDDNHRQTIATHKLQKGLWRVKVSWESNGTTYYQEKPLVL